jgi:hypothetical protein
MRHIQHQEHTESYLAGWEAMTIEVAGMGFDAARDKFNSENPISQKPSSMAAYYYACGGIDCLCMHI